MGPVLANSAVDGTSSTVTAAVCEVVVMVGA